MAYWNINRILNDSKKEEVLNGMETHGISIFCVAETLRRQGNQEKLSLFSGYNILHNKRGFGQKGGGGLLTIINPRIRYLRYSRVDEECPEGSTEREWILLHEKLANLQ